MRRPASSVLILAEDPALARQVSGILTGAGHRAFVCERRVAFEQRAREATCGVVVVPWIDLDDWVAWLTSLSLRHPALPLILVTSDHPDNLRALGRVPIRFHSVLYASELDRVEALVAGQPFETFFSTLTACIRAAGYLPLALRRALLYVLHQTPSPEPVDKLDAGAPVRSVVALAKRLNYSPDYLGQLAAASGVRLARFIRLCVTFRALELMLVAGATEEEAAWRMGFRYASGLSDHVLRTVGMRPSEIGLEHLPALASRFEAEFAPLLSSRGGTSMDSTLNPVRRARWPNQKIHSGMRRSSRNAWHIVGSHRIRCAMPAVDGLIAWLRSNGGHSRVSIQVRCAVAKAYSREFDPGVCDPCRYHAEHTAAGGHAKPMLLGLLRGILSRHLRKEM